MKKFFVAAVALMPLMAASALESNYATSSVVPVETSASYRVTMYKIGGGMKIKRTATVEVNDGEVTVDGYRARSGDGYGYSYVVDIRGTLWGFNL